MKRALAFLALCALCLFLCGCAASEAEPNTLAVSESAFTLSADDNDPFYLPSESRSAAQAEAVSDDEAEDDEGVESKEVSAQDEASEKSKAPDVSVPTVAEPSPTEPAPSTASASETPAASEATEAPASETPKASEATEAPETPASAASASVTVPDAPAMGDNLVWVPTNGGKKYHKNSTCSKMNEPMQVTVETATANGYTPCKRCYK